MQKIIQQGMKNLNQKNEKPQRKVYADLWSEFIISV